MRLPRTLLGVVVSSLVATPASRLVVLVGSAVSVTSCESGDCTGSVMPETLPDGRVSQPYFFQLKVELTGPDCIGPADFDKIDYGERGLPAGIKLSEDGALDGSPRWEGTYSFGVTGHFMVESGDSYFREATTRRYQLTILPR